MGRRRKVRVRKASGTLEDFNLGKFRASLRRVGTDEATIVFGGYVWLLCLLFYTLCLVLLVLLMRPRLVITPVAMDVAVLAESAT